MSELPDLSAQKLYALDQLAQLQGKIIQLSKSMVLQRARIERCRQSDLAAARDIYAELSRTRETLVETLAQVQLFLMEMEEYALAKVSGQLRQGLAGFALMSTGYKSVYEALSRFASSLPVGQKTNAAVVGRLMNNIKLGYYPTDPDNIALLLRGIRFPEGVTTNLLDPCCGCGKALRQLAQGNNCYAYGVELDESRAEEAQTRLHRVGFGSFFHSSISREAFHLLFLNPPYLSVINESGGRSRHEKRFLIESLPALAYGGLLIYVIPYYRLTPDICRILVDNFDDLTVWRFTESEFRKFKQVAVLGVRKPRGTELQDTPMFFYPFSNVHSNDRVCTGNNVLPRYRKISALKNFPRYLLGLPDNDDMYDREHNRLKLSHGELLEHLKDKDPAYYYTDILVSNGKTLGDFISRR